MKNENRLGIQSGEANMLHQRRSEVSVGKLLPEMLIAGCIGAVTVALWFLLLDLIAGRPLYTPTALGTLFFQQSADTVDLQRFPVSIDIVFKYSVLHGFAFILVGGLAVFFLTLVGEDLSLVVGVLLMFVLFVGLEFGFRVVNAILFTQDIHQVLGWSRILIGHLLAAGTMGICLIWRRLPQEDTTLS